MSTKSMKAMQKGLILQAVMIVVLLSLSLVLPDYWMNYLTVWIIFGLLALSLDLVWGFGGIVSFGQTAFFGVGGYVYGIVGINLMKLTGESISAVLAAALISALFAAILGWFLFYGRINDMYLSIITLAVPLVILTLLAGTADSRYAVGDALLGGFNGMIGIPPITLGLPKVFGISLNMKAMYIFIVLLAWVVYLGTKILLQKPFGRVLVAVRENEVRTELLGYDVRLVKLIAFSIAGGIAGLAGACFAAWQMFISPSIFELAQGAKIIIWLLVGGHGTIIGGFIGAVVIGGLTVIFGSTFPEYVTIMLGLVLIVFVLFVPNGLVHLFTKIGKKIQGSGLFGEKTQKSSIIVVPSDIKLVESDMLAITTEKKNTSEPNLSFTGLSKSFDGFRAVSNVSGDFYDQNVYCLIGPNGAGKSTLFNLLIGRYRSDEGKIILKGKDVTKLDPHKRVRCGMGIKLQVCSIYNNLPVYENVWLATQRQYSNPKQAEQVIWTILSRMGLVNRAGDLAGRLSHGEQQRLEIGMVLASKPNLILLDEPAAGMTREEAMQLVDTVKELGKYGTVIVVEHDIEFVRQLKAPVIVFHQGKVFMEGNIEELQNNETLLEVYLGGNSRVANQ